MSTLMFAKMTIFFIQILTKTVKTITKQAEQGVPHAEIQARLTTELIRC